jgi:hypothetical protein
MFKESVEFALTEGVLVGVGFDGSLIGVALGRFGSWSGYFCTKCAGSPVEARVAALSKASNWN